MACSTDRHETNPSRIRVHHAGISDTVSLDGGVAVVRETQSLVITKIFDFRTTSEGRSESAPFQPDLAVV